MCLHNKIVILICFVLIITKVFSQCPVGYQIGGADRAVNGQFTDGNSGFTSEYTYVANTTGSTELNPEGYYSVWDNPIDLHSAFANNLNITGTGNMMIINGSPTANQFIWKQTIAVNPNTLYYFVTDVASVHTTSPAQLQFSVNGVLLGSIFNATATVLDWKTFYATWNSDGSSSAIISIVNQNTAATGNDFAIDNISFIPCNIMLPVELVNFQINKKNNENVNLIWQTASETNNDFFTVERSIDGEKFNPIGIVKSKNANSTTLLDYAFVDKETPNGIVYYRLKQTDIDGKSKYSKIVSHNYIQTENNIDVNVYPNPSVQKVTIDFNGNKNEIQSICILNVYGEFVYESSYYQSDLIFENLNSGMYILRILLNSKNTIEKKFIVR